MKWPQCDHKLQNSRAVRSRINLVYIDQLEVSKNNTCSLWYTTGSTGENWCHLQTCFAPPLARRWLPKRFLSLTFAMRDPNCIALFTKVEHSCTPIILATLLRISLSPSPCGRFKLHFKCKGISSKKATTSSSRYGKRATGINWWWAVYSQNIKFLNKPRTFFSAVWEATIVSTKVADPKSPNFHFKFIPQLSVASTLKSTSMPTIPCHLLVGAYTRKKNLCTRHYSRIVVFERSAWRRVVFTGKHSTARSWSMYIVAVTKWNRTPVVMNRT